MILKNPLIKLIKLCIVTNGVDKTTQFLCGILIDICREEKTDGYRITFPFGETVEVLINDHIEEIAQ
jgi:hypothetical protein